MKRLVCGAGGLLLSACVGSPGQIVNPTMLPEAFVREQDAVIVSTRSGLVRLRIDGSGREPLFAAGFRILDLARDGSLFAVGDEDTNLYVMRSDDRRIHRVPELDARAGAVRLSPDGRRLAASRHADFSLPQSRWDETQDDRIYLIDTETREVRILPESTRGLVMWLVWSNDGTALWIGLQMGAILRLDPATGTRARVAAWPTEGLDEPDRSPATCPATGETLVERGDDEGLDLVSPSGGVRRLVLVEGRKRGFHDHEDTISNSFFSGSCRYVVFVFDRRTWVVDVASTTVGMLIEGGDPFLALAPRD